MNKDQDILKVGLAQMAPIWLDRDKTLEKVSAFIENAAEQNCELVVFGEALVPGYPFWVERTDGARFNSELQKEIFAHYLKQGVQIEAGHLNNVCRLAKEKKITVVIGIVERAPDRGGHSMYCTLVYIGNDGQIKHTHRKLMPTYEERLVWSIGDGNGLQVQSLKNFTTGALNCYENWMPLSRAALYGQGEDLHIALWPGSKHNTENITRFIAQESRSFVISVSGLMRKTDVPNYIPHADIILENSKETLANGGSCLANPTGKWIIEPQINSEGIFAAEIDFGQVRQERQNFDLAGHYSRPDVTKLIINRERQSIVFIK
ncbi:MAG: carbon-nitrogen hydrolase family protein [Prolixibacteraceae bacterium]|jgi:nitrilase|nr:carbon-nitrogen hydrolase family protein [Prolixibacteraceae bacterium]MBT6007293.1 carbon-nitrogen hydrolase family protein [Prolixibacteraceae bacterium]MBT6764128.1 carbon-nitrogen hydrolase family protein [Prolixibacteraceae bacterium]MBT6998997.1 carbon-nitrogen hydrolase family protein [Prolixibacteraceae bacterium]MBT7394504.1 carbon-nitrogen hydrolase family protein [Prolixibacteraceae bacterium]